MAVREIKTTIALDGEQKFKQAIAAASREMRVMDSELKAVTAAYENNGDAAAYYAQKQANLKNQISQQKQIITSLEQAVKDATEAYGAGSSEVDGYAIKLNNARTRMSKLEKQLEETDRSVEELGRDSIKAGRQLEQGIGEGAEEAERDVKSLIKTMQEDISSIRTSSAVSAITGLWNTATSAFSSADGFVSGTAELRRQMSFLAQNAQTQGFDFEFIKGQLTEVTTLTGDTSTSIEAVSNLMAVPGMEAGTLVSAVDLLAGAVASFPDTLKFESLADSLQETIATGQATGQYAELLGRLGVSTEDFNKALAESETEAGDLDIAMAYLAQAGMSAVYEQWKKNNQAMIEASETQSELEYELSKFGGTLESYIVTPVKELLVEALKWVNDHAGADFQEALIQGGEMKLQPGIGGAEITYTAPDVGFSTVEEAKKNRQGDIKRTENGNIIYDNTIGPPTLEQYVENDMAEPGQFFNRYELGARAAKKALERVFNQGDDEKYNMLDLLITPSYAEEAENKGEETAKAYLNGMDMQLDMSALEAEAENAALVTIQPVSQAMTDWEKFIADAQKKLENNEKDFGAAGEGVADAFASAFEKRAVELAGQAGALGAIVGVNFGAGLMSSVSYINSAASVAAAAAKAAMGAGMSGARPVILQVDGRELARTTAEYTAGELSISE